MGGNRRVPPCAAKTCAVLAIPAAIYRSAFRARAPKSTPVNGGRDRNAVRLVFVRAVGELRTANPRKCPRADEAKC